MSIGKPGTYTEELSMVLEQIRQRGRHHVTKLRKSSTGKQISPSSPCLLQHVSPSTDTSYQEQISDYKKRKRKR